MKSIGQAAYEAWRERISPPPHFDWERLPNPAKIAWEEIATIVVFTHLENNRG